MKLVVGEKAQTDSYTLGATHHKARFGFLRKLKDFKCTLWSVDTTLCSECTHFQWLRKNLIWNLSSPQILQISECGRLIKHLLQKFCKCVVEKHVIAIFSLIRTYFHVKKPKGQTYFLRPGKLRWGQKKSKGQLKFFRPTNLKQGQISEIWPEKGQPGNPDRNHRRAQVSKRWLVFWFGLFSALSISRCYILHVYCLEA